MDKHTAFDLINSGQITDELRLITISTLVKSVPVSKLVIKKLRLKSKNSTELVEILKIRINGKTTIDVRICKAIIKLGIIKNTELLMTLVYPFNDYYATSSVIEQMKLNEKSEAELLELLDSDLCYILANHILSLKIITDKIKLWQMAEQKSDPQFWFLLAKYDVIEEVSELIDMHLKGYFADYYIMSLIRERINFTNMSRSDVLALCNRLNDQILWQRAVEYGVFDDNQQLLEFGKLHPFNHNWRYILDKLDFSLLSADEIDSLLPLAGQYEFLSILSHKNIVIEEKRLFDLAIKCDSKEFWIKIVKKALIKDRQLVCYAYKTLAKMMRESDFYVDKLVELLDQNSVSDIDFLY